MTESGPGRAHGRGREIGAIVLFALGAFVLVSLYAPAGVVGEGLAVLMRRALGAGAILAALLVWWGALGLVSRGRWRSQWERALGLTLGAAAVLVVLAWWDMRPPEPPLPRRWGPQLWHAIQLYLAAETPRAEAGQGGGLAGALLLALGLAAFGEWGTLLVAAALLLVALVLSFNLSFTRLAAALARRGGRAGVGLGRAGWRTVVAAFRWTVASVADGVAAARDWGGRATGQAVTRLRQGRTRRGGRPAASAARAEAVEDWPTLPLPMAEEDDDGGAHPTVEARGGAGRRPVHGEVPARGFGHGSSGAEVGPHSAHRRAAGEPTAPGSAVRAPAPARSEGSGSAGGWQAALPLAEARPYILPSTHLLRRAPAKAKVGLSKDSPDQRGLLEETLKSFGIQAKVVQVSCGPVITRYELQPAPGIKVSRIVSLQDDIALSLAAAGVRIEAPVPGKPVIGIEVPNKERAVVYLRDILESDEFQKNPSKLTVALGKDIAGNPVVADLTKLIHLLIAGSTGSGKSVCLGSIITSLLFKAQPHELKLLMIDPKRVELTVYDGIPHLVAPVVTDPKKAATALRWVVRQMEERYQLFAAAGVRNILSYNEAVREGRLPRPPEDGDGAAGAPAPQPLPYMVVIIDELADLMLVAAHDVEDAICRLAQMARAAGIHLIVATQRPSVDVITGLIKANIPSRLAFAVASQVDSRTILDMAGAERLVGRGDMLFHPAGEPKPLRAQGALVTDKEIADLVAFWKNQGTPVYEENLEAPAPEESGDEAWDDDLLPDAIELVTDMGQASVSLLQRRFRIGYSRAARLIDMMEQQGIVGPYQGSKPREVLVGRHAAQELRRRADP